MANPHFQFTIRGILWATFWVAVTAAAWVICGPHAKELTRLMHGAAIAAIVFAPLFALMSVFGRTTLALGIWLGWLLLLFLWPATGVTRGPAPVRSPPAVHTLNEAQPGGLNTERRWMTIAPIALFRSRHMPALAK